MQSEEQITLRVLAGMVNCGWSEEDCWVALLDPAALGGRFLQGMNARNAVRARRWLARQYANTGRWAASSPAGDRLHDTLVLADVAAGLESAAGFSPGPKGVTERAVLRSLVEQARQRSSVLVRRSQRQLSLDTQATLPAVNSAVRSLQLRGWLKARTPGHGPNAAVYELRRPAGKAITESPLLKGGKGFPVTTLPGSIPTVFAAHGLGRGVFETYSCLPLYTAAASRGFVTLASVHTSPEAGRAALTASTGLRQSSTSSDGVTVEDLSAATGKDASTVRRHLKVLQRAGLALRRGFRWFRYVADLDEVAAALGYEDRRGHKALRYRLDQVGWYDYLLTPRGRARHGNKVELVIEDGAATYFAVDRNGVRGRRLLRRPLRPDERPALGGAG